MRRYYIYALALVALVACIGCSKANTDIEGTPFQEGQKVVLSTYAPCTKVTTQMEGGAYVSRWDAGDQILVTVGGSSAVFGLKSGVGETYAEFEGQMPLSGNKFDVQYPTTAPSLTTQTYSATTTPSLPQDKMLFKAKDCTLDNPFSLIAQNAAICLKFYGEGVQLSKIVLTNITASPNVSYTLDCPGGVTVASTKAEATQFLIVVEQGSYNFKIELYDNAATPTKFCTFSTHQLQSVVANNVLTMPEVDIKSPVYPEAPDKTPVKVGDVWVAPVNCGYSSQYPYGLMYQWGRKAGTNFNDGTYTSEGELIQKTVIGPVSTVTAARDDEFYTSSTNPFYWLTYVDNTLWNKGTYAAPSKGDYDPCPDGWRVPSVDELGKILFSDWNSSTHSGTTPKGVWDPATKTMDVDGLKFYVTGRRVWDTGVCDLRENSGFLWSCSYDIDHTHNSISFAIRSARGIINYASSHKGYALNIRCIFDD